MDTVAPKVSVLLAVYQGEVSLSETLRSLEEQTYRDWELVAVNDGSTDKTAATLEAFKKKHDSATTIVHNAVNVGLTKSLVLAAGNARGTYLARIDSGDLFHPDKLEKQMDFLEQHPSYGVVGCNFINVMLPGRAAKKSNVPLTDEEIHKAILRKNPFAHSCIVMRAEQYRAAGGYDEALRYGQDYDLWFRLLKRTQAANLPEYLCTRMMDEGSISFQKQRSQMWQTLKTQWKYMRRGNPAHYAYLLEPFFVMATPGIFRRWKRRR